VRSVTTPRNSLLATGALLLTTASWGSTFFLIKDLLERVPTLDFLGVRFAIAAVALVLVAPRALGRLSREARRHAIVLGPDQKLYIAHGNATPLVEGTAPTSRCPRAPATTPG